MKKAAITVSVLLASMSIINAQKKLTPQVRIADKANGLLHVSVTYKTKGKIGRGMVDPYADKNPEVDWESAKPAILERCKTLGYSNYKLFEQPSDRRCIEQSMRGCERYELIWECQCTNEEKK